MITAQEVFNYAMSLMDEVDESTGKTDTEDTKEYKNRTLAILNILKGELYPFSDTYTSYKSGERAVASTIEDFDSPIDLDDYLCATVMPYGLAAHLLLDENPSTAGFFSQRYDELKMVASRGLPSESEDIIDAYGGTFEYNNFGTW